MPDQRAGHIAERLERGQRRSGLRAGEVERGGDRRRRSPPPAPPPRERRARSGSERRPGALERPRPGPEHRVEHVLGVADDAGAAGEQVVRAGRGARGRPGPGTAPRSRPRSAARSAVISEPERCRRLDDDRHPGQGGHDPVAGREGPAPGAGPRRQLGDDEAALADPPPERSVGGRVGDVGAAAEHGDGAARLRARPGARRRRCRRRGR